jgi:hypothetical protein
MIMIVLNGAAIPVLFFIGIIIACLDWLIPGFIGSPHGMFVASVVVLVVGGVTELLGLAGRVFWLPIWLFGLFATGYTAWSLWGLWSLGFAGAMIVGFVGLVVRSKHMEAKRWAAAPDALQEAQLAWQVENLERTWAAMEKCFCANTSDEYDTVQSAHNAKVLELLLKIVGERIPPDRLSYIEGIRQRFNKGVESAESVKLPYEMAAWIARYTGEHGLLKEDPPEEEAKQNAPS